jgi:hypothetical protein
MPVEVSDVCRQRVLCRWCTRTLTQQRPAVNLSVSENSAGNPSEFGKELPLATKHSVFSIAESREGLRLAHRNLAFHLHYHSASVVLKNTDISTTKAAVELALTLGWRRLLFAVFGGGSMKVMRSAFLGLGFLLAVSAAQAQEPRVKANIPFDFVVGDRVMPAGEYQVSEMGASGHAIAILSEDRKANALVVNANGVVDLRDFEAYKPDPFVKPAATCCRFRLPRLELPFGGNACVFRQHTRKPS